MSTEIKGEHVLLGLGFYFKDWFVFEIQAADVDFELAAVLLPQPPEGWVYK